MKGLRLIIRLVTGGTLVSVLLFATSNANSIQAALQSEHKEIFRESTQSQQDSSTSSAALAEAARLSRTVVKLFNEGKYDEALPLAKRALELRETVLGPDHEMVQGALLNLSEIYTSLKKYGEARKLVERLLRTHEMKIGPEDAGVAIFLDKLAYLAYAQRDFGKTEAAYKRAIAIREKAFGESRPELATSLYLLAEFYRFTGKNEKAQPLYERSTILRGKLLGREHPDYLKVKERYFCLALETGQEQKLKDFEKKIDDMLGTKAPGVSEDAILNGRAVSLPKPSYSDEARRYRAHGRVVIKVTIDELGHVIDASDMCGGDPLLVKPSLQSAREARFTPTKVSGQPVRVTGVITYNFVAQ